MAGPAYQIPSWLQTSPEDSVKNYVSGLQIGAQLGEARNKLAQQAQQSAVENEVTATKLAQSAMQQQQELQVKKAYEDQQLSLKAQQVQAAQAKVQNETMKAAHQFQAQQSFQKDYQDALDSGMSPDEASRGAVFKNIGMFGTGAAMASAIKAPNTRGGAPTTTVLTGADGRKHAMAYIPGSLAATDLDRGTPTATGDFTAEPLLDSSGKALPGKYTVPGPGGSRRVITQTLTNPNKAAIKALEDGQYGIWLSSGRDPKTITPEYTAAKSQYQALKSGAAAPDTSTKDALKIKSITPVDDGE